MRSRALLPLCLLAACSRIANVEEDPIDYETLRAEACGSACEVMDTCDPERFSGMDPDDCFERCMTMLPRLQQENQCGSRDMIWLNCIGTLTCEEFALNEAGGDLSQGPPDYTAPCVTELFWAGECDEARPFDLDEPVPDVP